MIKAVIFDIDGVLLDSLEANYQYYLHLFKRFNNHFVPKQEYNDNYEGMPMKVMLSRVMGFTGSKLEEEFELAKRETPHFQELYKVPRGEQKVIKELSRKYKLALVTSRYGVESTFSTIGLKECFSVVIKFGDYQKPKPDPEPLFVAIGKLQIKPEEAVYIGDRESDLLAAKAAGMKFVGFPLYSGKKLEGSDAIFMNFSELPGVIENLSKN